MHLTRVPAVAPVILVADDEEVVRRLLQRLFERQGFGVLLAGDGCEAVELFARHRERVRLVLLDVLMLRLDGPGALAHMADIDPAVVSCFMTGYAAQYDEGDLLRRGARRVFHKPFHLSDVTRTVRELCPAARCA